MWRSVDVAGKKYFSRLQNEPGKIEFVLFDADKQESWSECLPSAVERYKELNACPTLNDDSIDDAIRSLSPVETTLEIVSDSERILKVKYVTKQSEFLFQYRLLRQSIEEFKNTIVIPLFTAINSMGEQIKELREAVRKKDIEIAQYKIEGASLRRKTVTTQRFNFEASDDQFHGVADLLQIANYLTSRTANKAQDNEASPSTKSAEKRSQVNSPRRNRKRKAKALQEDYIARKVLASRKALTYESQSQSSSHSGSQSPRRELRSKSKANHLTAVEENKNEIEITENMPTERQDSDEDILPVRELAGAGDIDVSNTKKTKDVTAMVEKSEGSAETTEQCSVLQTCDEIRTVNSAESVSDVSTTAATSRETGKMRNELQNILKALDELETLRKEDLNRRKH